MRVFWVIGVSCLWLAAGCDESGQGLSKHEARELGPSTWEQDHCSSEDWYGDGECDAFCPSADGDCDPALEAKARAFIDAYVVKYAKREQALTLADWKVSTSGTEADYTAYSAAQIELFTVHLDAAMQKQLKSFLEDKAKLSLFTRRSLEVMEPFFSVVDLPVGELGKLLKVIQNRNEVIDLLGSYKAEIGGTQHSTLELGAMLRKETDAAKRKELWLALRGVGASVGPKIIEAVKLGNDAAAALGFASFWEWSLKKDDQDPKQMIALFQEIDTLTDKPYREVKKSIDAEVAARFGIKPGEVMIWHYDNAFFQEPPPAPNLDLNKFYRDRTKEQTVDLAAGFFKRLGLDVSDVVKRSDLYARDNKWHGAFMTDIDRKGDIRVLLNTSPDHGSVATALHEFGHAADHKYRDPGLPFLLHTANHTLTTEAVAMLFGDQSLTSEFLVQMAGADAGQAKALEQKIREQLRRRELVFARFTLVMFHFERKLYEKPGQDLDKLWWDLVEKYQLVKRPPNRKLPDWACKSHFATNPVYYHNYMLGKLFGAQVRATLIKQSNHAGPVLGYSFLADKGAADFLKQKIFRYGKDLRWSELLQHATGEPMRAKYFAESLTAAP
jgi:peptidyl-dipeptidase A